MKSALLWGLGALNVLLAVVLINRFVPDQKAMAQARPGDYMMVPGQLNGISTGVVFVIDTTKQELSVMTFDDNKNTLVPSPKIDLNQVFKAGGGVGGGKKP